MKNDDLKILESAVVAGSFKGAASKLYMSQSAVSKSIKRLEDEIGFQLFSRELYRPVITDKGKAFYNKSKEVLAKLDELNLLSQNLEMGHEPEIGVAFSHHCPDAVLTLLKKCAEENPHTELNLFTEYLGGIMERLMSGDADIAIVPWTDRYLEVESIPLGIVTMSTVAAPTLPPLQTKCPLTTTEMKKYPQIVIRDSSRSSSSINHGILEGGRHWSVNDILIKKRIIMAGLGWGSLPNTLIEEELQKGSLIALKIKNYETTRKLDLRVARRANQQVGPVAGKLWEMFAEMKR